MSNLDSSVPVKRSNGRPTVYSEERAEKLLAFVRVGNFLQVAAKLVDIDRHTLQKWRKWGAAGKEPFVEFERKLVQAELECEAWHVQNWRDQAPQDWRASQAFLQRRHPERWSDHAAKLAVLGPETVRIGDSFQITIHLGEPPRGSFPKPRAIEPPAIPVEVTKEPRDPTEPRN